MYSLPLLDTPSYNKIYVPNRLLVKLDTIFQYPLTIIIAPSGSGKTIAVQEYLKNTSIFVNKYWYITYGESLHMIWNRLCAVISKIDEKTANSLRALDSPMRERLSEVAELIQEICCTTKTILVIDNYQLIQSDAPYELLTALSQHGNDNLHIVIITQHLNDDIPIPLSAPHIAKLDASNFLFNEKEIASYFKLYGFSLTDDELKHVMEHTYGWISAIRLQLLNYQLTGQIGKELGIQWLLHTVVWDTLDPHDQILLASLSLFPNVNTRQISIMLGSPLLLSHTIKLLNELIFISFDNDTQSYIIHNILWEFLQERFNEYGEEEKKKFYFRAGKAQCSIQEFFSALQFFSLSCDYDAALSVPLRNNDLIGIKSSIIDAVLEKIMRECPKEKLLHYPNIFLVLAFEQCMRKNEASFDVCCSIIRETIDIYEESNNSNMKKVRGEYYFLLAYTVFNDVIKMNEFHQLALMDLNGPSNVFDFNHSWTTANPSVLYQYWRNTGNLSNEIYLLENYMLNYMVLTNGHGTGGAVLMRAEAALYSGQLSSAESFCHKALYLASTKQQDIICFGAEFSLARIAILRGDAKAYVDYLSALRNRMLTGKENTRHLVYDQCRMWLSLSFGQTENISEWIMNENSIQSYVYGSYSSFAMMLYARLLLILQNFNKLLGLSDVLLNMAKSIPMQLPRVYYLIYIACAKVMTNHREEAINYLKKALHIALPDEIYLPFAEHGIWLESLLKDIRYSIPDTQGFDRILTMCTKQKAGINKIKRSFNKTKSSLTVREIEIAQLAKKGMTNKEIAKVLFIAPETVKMALKKIFQKLDIHSRHQLSDKIS